MLGIFIAGAAGGVGRRLADRMVAAGGYSPVIAFDRRATPTTTPGISVITGDLATADVKSALEGIDAIVHLAWSSTHPADAVEAWRRVLDAAGDAGAGRVVFVSSAIVYGAWADNPLPLTEDAPVRPTSGFADAAARAEAERIAWDWVADHPGTRLTILRPALVLTGDDDPSLTQMLGPPRRLPRGAPGPPRQFVHVDDLVTAIVHVLEGAHDGVYNVAPDGWAPAEDTRTLAVWGSTSGDLPAASRPYSRHPWVVAKDRLRATGWAPTSTTEEAVVATRQGVWWRELSPHSRQQLTLAMAAGAALAAGSGVFAALRRRRGARPG